MSITPFNSQLPVMARTVPSTSQGSTSSSSAENTPLQCALEALNISYNPNSRQLIINHQSPIAISSFPKQVLCLSKNDTICTVTVDPDRISSISYPQSYPPRLLKKLIKAIAFLQCKKYFENQEKKYSFDDIRPLILNETLRILNPSTDEQKQQIERAIKDSSRIPFQFCRFLDTGVNVYPNIFYMPMLVQEEIDRFLPRQGPWEADFSNLLLTHVMVDQLYFDANDDLGNDFPQRIKGYFQNATSLNLRDNRLEFQNPYDFRFFNLFPKLERLNLSNSRSVPPSSEVSPCLNELPSTEQLKNQPPFNRLESLDFLKEVAATLSSLNVASTPIKNLAGLKHCPNLKSLNIAHCKDLTDLTSLLSLPNLSQLTLCRCCYTKDLLEQIETTLPTLSRIDTERRLRYAPPLSQS